MAAEDVHEATAIHPSARCSGGLAAGCASREKCGRDRVARIGVLWHAGSEDEEREYYSVLMQAFRDLGHVEGKNAEFLHRYPAERIERFDNWQKTSSIARPS